MNQLAQQHALLYCLSNTQYRHLRRTAWSCNATLCQQLLRYVHNSEAIHCVEAVAAITPIIAFLRIIMCLQTKKFWCMGSIYLRHYFQGTFRFPSTKSMRVNASIKIVCPFLHTEDLQRIYEWCLITSTHNALNYNAGAKDHFLWR